MGACQSNTASNSISSGSGPAFHAEKRPRSLIKALPYDAACQLKGCYNEYKITEKPECCWELTGCCHEGAMDEKDCIDGCFTIKWCEDKGTFHTDGCHNNSCYCVDKHYICVDNCEYPLFKVHPAKKKATDTLCCEQKPCFKFEKPSKVYTYDCVANYCCVMEVKEENCGWKDIPVCVEKLTKPICIIIVPLECEELSCYKWTKGDGCKKACIFKHDKMEICKTVYDVSGVPYCPKDFPYGPDHECNIQGDRRRFFCIGGCNYAWQCQATGHGKISCFEPLKSSTCGMPIEENHTLVGAVCTKDNCFIYVTAENGCAGDGVTPRKACIVHAKCDGTVIL